MKIPFKIHEITMVSSFSMAKPMAFPIRSRPAPSSGHSTPATVTPSRPIASCWSKGRRLLSSTPLKNDGLSNSWHGKIWKIGIVPNMENGYYSHMGNINNSQLSYSQYGKIENVPNHQPGGWFMGRISSEWGKKRDYKPRNIAEDGLWGL